MKNELLARLRPSGNEHLLHFWDQLAPDAQQQLAGQIEQIDFDQISHLVADAEHSQNWADLANQAEPPPAFRRDASAGNRFTHQEARERGEEALRQGQLGMILVAGGQGTRLGFPLPKGMFTLGPVSGRSLFQMLIDRIRAVGQRYGAPVPLYLMTSPATHQETVKYLEENDRFGLAADDLHIFCQGVMPAVDPSGRVLLASESSLCLSPDGHGGMLQALHRTGGLASAQARGVEHFFYGQVDNPLTQICDPELVGFHLLCESEMTTQAVRKKEPLDRVGNVVLIDGKVQIIEYSDLPDDVAQQRSPDGALRLWAGNIAVHVLQRAFLDRMANSADGLPFHRAEKKVPHLNIESGEQVDPQQPNAVKFERFIFDLLPSAQNAIVVEADATEAFAPVKNADTEAKDTATTARAAMTNLYRDWLQSAGATVEGDSPIEISPLMALDKEELRGKIKPGDVVSTPVFLAECG